jgi:hypothetical protein
MHAKSDKQVNDLEAVAVDPNDPNSAENKRAAKRARSSARRAAAPTAISTPSSANMKVALQKCWRYPWVTSLLVLGIVIANATVIQGAKDAADSIATITFQVSNLTQQAIENVDVIQSNVESTKLGLLNYSNSVINVLEDLKAEASKAKSDLTTKVQKGIANASYVIEFQFVKEKIDKTLQTSADRGFVLVKKIIERRSNNSIIEKLAANMLMVSDMVVEIEKYEEMVTQFGNVVVGAVNDYGMSGNKTISIDFRVFFQYLDDMQEGMGTLTNFIENGPLVTLSYELPSTEIRASAVVGAMASTSSVNITAVLESQFNKIFTQIEDTIDVAIDR